MLLKKGILLTIVGALITPWVVTAKNKIPVIIITATKTPQIIEDTLSPIVVINREEINRSQAADVADIIKFNAGLDIARNGGPGQTTSLFTRGTESDHTLVLIDGVKINPGTAGGAALQFISPDIIDRIEIIKGPRSTLYGSEAIGGVINIITHQPVKTTYSAEIRQGSFNTQSAAMSFAGVKGNLTTRLNLSHLKTDGFPTKSASTLDSGHRNTSVSSFIGGRFNSTEVTFNHWQASGNTEYLDFSLTPLDQDFHNSSTSIKSKTSFLNAGVSSFTLGNIQDKIDQKQGADFTHTERLTLDWQHDLPLGAQLLTAGVAAASETVSASIFGSAFDEKTMVKSLYIQDDLLLGRTHLVASTRLTDHETFGKVTTWNIEYGYQLNNKTSFISGMGTAFRSPNSTDRFGFGGNLNLKPETSQNIELGLRYSFGTDHDISTTLFQNKIDNIINFDTVNNVFINIDKSTIKGLETHYKISKPHWGSRLTLLVQDPHNHSSGGLLPRRAKRSLSSNSYYKKGKLLINGNIIINSKRKDSDFNSKINAAYELVNLGFMYSYNKQTQIQLKIENVFNKQYELANGFNTADRSVYAGIKYQAK